MAVPAATNKYPTVTANVTNRRMTHLPIVGQVGTQYAHQRTTSPAGINRILGEGCEKDRCPRFWLANGPLPDPRGV